MNKKILLLEDDVALNETIVDFLESLNYDITSVYDGFSAQDTIYENNFDLLLLDINVPDINGFEILKNIREQSITTPAIFISSLMTESKLTSLLGTTNNTAVLLLLSLSKRTNFRLSTDLEIFCESPSKETSESNHLITRLYSLVLATDLLDNQKKIVAKIKVTKTVVIRICPAP